MFFGFLSNNSRPESNQTGKLFPRIKYKNGILVLLISVHTADSSIFLSIIDSGKDLLYMVSV